MQQQEATRPDGPTFGFLTVVDSPTHGVFGGYLVVDELGRPVEFHCTTPVKVSRAQQILYGPTLHGHLHGRQIGATLLAEGATQPEIVLTDVESMLQVRPHTDLPVALVRRAEEADGGRASPSAPPACGRTRATGRARRRFRIGSPGSARRSISASPSSGFGRRSTRRSGTDPFAEEPWATHRLFPARRFVPCAGPR
jgi:hypothetical protein